MNSADKIKSVAEEIAATHKLLANAMDDREQKDLMLKALDRQIIKTRENLEALYVQMRKLLTPGANEPAILTQGADEPATPIPVMEPRRKRNNPPLAEQIVAFLEENKGKAFTSNEIADRFSDHKRSSVTARLAQLSKGRNRIRHQGKMYSAFTHLNSLQGALPKHDPKSQEDRIAELLKGRPKELFQPLKVAKLLNLSQPSCAALLHRLRLKGAVERVQRGVYRAKTEKAPEVAPPVSQAEKVLAYLQENAVKKSVQADDIAKATGIPSTNVRTLLSRLFATGAILRTIPGHYAYPNHR